MQYRVLLNLFLFAIVMSSSCKRVGPTENMKDPIRNANTGSDSVIGESNETVEMCLDRLKLRYEDAEFLDEPPGKLSLLRFGRSDGSAILIKTNYDTSLFSKSRKWERQKVLAARVTRVFQE